MSTQPSSLPQSFESQSIAIPSWLQAFYWSIRRELWEYRSIYLVPLAAAGIAIIGFLIHVPQNTHLAHTAGSAHHQDTLVTPYAVSAMLIMGVAFVVSIFYSLDALYGERRDRSILFWKSLPVSDLIIVLAKTTVALVVLPMVAFLVTAIAVAIMLPLHAFVIARTSITFAQLWNQLAISRAAGMLLYHLVTVHILWYAPFYGWLLLVSAWARRAPFLWATLPPAIIAGFEKITFRTSYFLNLLRDRFMGGTAAVEPMGGDRMPFDPALHVTPGQFLASPGLWIGLAVTAVFLALAVHLRHTREPI
jgi:ABC-2 type transport system permease protein